MKVNGAHLSEREGLTICRCCRVNDGTELALVAVRRVLQYFEKSVGVVQDVGVGAQNDQEQQMWS